MTTQYDKYHPQNYTRNAVHAQDVTEQADYRPLIWVASILIVTLVIWACVTLAQ